MPIKPPAPLGHSPAQRAGFRGIGLVFIALGMAAILAPAFATLVVEQLVAWLLVAWGLAGLGYALSFRGISEWRILAVFFAVVLLAGLGLVVLPGRGATWLTACLVVVLLLEGALSILLGLRLSGQLRRWRWVVASGVCAFGLGLAILAQWPGVAGWVLGALAGLNFISTGVSLLMLAPERDDLTP